MRDDPQRCPLLDDLFQSDMHFVCVYATALIQKRNIRNQLQGTKAPQTIVYSPTCSEPLKTYSRQPSTGLRASGGSLYFKTVLSPLTPFTVFVSAASRPDGAKFGLALLAGDADRDPDRDEERGRSECG